MSKLIRTAVIGLGGRGLYFADMYGNQKHGFQLRAVCDISDKVLTKARRKFGESVAYYTNMHRMLKDPEIDAVLVATNDPYHVAPTLAALRAGKHVLVEKPLCQTLADARKIAAAVRRARSVFMIGFELRNCTVVQSMRRLLDEGRIGRVMIGHVFDNVSVGGNYFFHDPRKQKAFFRSLLLQKATHSLDLLNGFMGSNPVKVYGIGGMDFYGRKASPRLQCRACRKSACPYRVKNPKAFQMDYAAVVEKADYCVWSKAMDLHDNAELCISYANGGKATFHECHFTPEYTREFWLVGDKGKMYGYYDNPGRFLIRIEYAHSPERRTEEFKPPYTGGGHGGGDDRLRDEFRERILRRDVKHNRAVMDQAYYSTALAVCAGNSIESGQAVVIPPLK